MIQEGNFALNRQFNLGKYPLEIPTRFQNCLKPHFRFGATPFMARMDSVTTTSNFFNVHMDLSYCYSAVSRQRTHRANASYQTTEL